MPRRFVPLFVLALLISCTDRPDLDGLGATQDPTAPWPELLPRAALETASAAPRPTPSTDALAARAAALAARARAVSARPVLSQAERNRLRAAIAQNQGR